MKQSAQRIDDNEVELPWVQHPRRLSFLKFLMRYPIFLLAFGPPILRHQAIDATKGVIDIWSFIQVGLLATITIRAIYRLAFAQSILIPKQIRSIFKLFFWLGALFFASVIYSPSRLISAAYCVLYFLTVICMIEFVVDIYKDPPDWMQCLFDLRFIALLLFAVVLFTFPFAPSIILTHEAGIRLSGGPVAPVTVICPIIAIISAYSFLHGLESRVRSVFFFLVGLVGTLITQSRGAELALLLCLAILGAGWAKTGKRSAYFFISSLMALILFVGAVVGAIGGGRIWRIVNRGESAEGIASASGREEMWRFVTQYCIAHPQGMGYVAGFRDLFREYFVLDPQDIPGRIGNAHNTYMQALADAGWLSLAIYLVLLVRIILLGWRFAKVRSPVIAAAHSLPQHALRCALLLLTFCLADGMDSADFCVPLREPFYLQNIIVAIILGISAVLLAASRTRYIDSTE